MTAIRTFRGRTRIEVTYELTQEENKMNNTELFDKVYAPFGGFGYKHNENQFTAVIYND